ncbi:hypothetical protein RMATCC62417_07274 [Rhizopus microsporus]|nr:hypothetical protein RMATCC62417_07274 [Rhizopus microsporus]
MKILILLSLLITLVTALRINNKQALAQLITSQIKTRIQSGLVFNISASITQTMKTHVSVQLETTQGIAQIQQRHIDAIQTAAISGLEVRLSNALETALDKIISLSKVLQLMPFMPKNRRQLKHVMTQAETLARSQIHEVLPDIEKILHLYIDTHIETHIRHLALNIPGLMKLQVNVDINLSGSIKTIIKSMCQSYVDISVNSAVESYLSHFYYK